MPLPTPRRALVQAPAGAGIGLRFTYYERVALPEWPDDWWQRNYDTAYYEPDAPDPLPWPPRWSQLPPPPEV